MGKQRADVLLVERGLCPSRARARALIEAGKVLLDGVTLAKPGALVDESRNLVVRELDHPYVSRGGLKLAGALAELQVEVAGCVVADIGASTGGFTDCALREGATRVYAIDVGHGQLAESLRGDGRVVVLERTNARHLDAHSLPEQVDLVLIDASFISLTKLLPALVTLMKPEGRLLALVKPQFEVGPEHIGKKGVVASDVQRARALAEVMAAASALGLSCAGHADACVQGPEGNREIFALFTRP